MRFKWRSHLAVTALTALSLLPFSGCSSQQQQQASDEVSASDQEGGEGQGEEDASADAQQQGQEDVSTEDAGTENGSETTQANPSDESINPEAMGEDVVSNPAANANAAPTTDGDLQEIINEMGGNGTAPVAATNPAMETVPAETAAQGSETAAVATPPAGGESVASAPIAGLPEIGSKMPYVIEAGDTLGKVAARIYGDQKRWKDISGLTGLSDPNHIFPGDVVYFSLDESSAQFASTYEGLMRSKETVQEGDTLASIAKRVYGSSRSWRHIWRQNDNIENPDQLTAGMTIYYVNKDAIKTASNNLKKQSKSLKTTNHVSKTMTKATWAKAFVNHGPGFVLVS